MADALATFPATRPVGYDADRYWQQDSWSGATYVPATWGTDHVGSGGGRWHEQLVCICQDRIMYEVIT
jgi:hypothetical protein